ncbi:MAG: HAMP domain-containing histidine kinase [Saprospiraceae bacterium]|nr:HAMP domain-containing histidine kinase [Saprospiraceae bacterium]
MQIRTRLTLVFGLITAGILAGVLLAVYVVYVKSTEYTFFQGLASKVEMTAQAALQGDSELKPLEGNWIAPDEALLPYLDNISIYNNSYERVFAVRPDAPPVSVKELQDIYKSGEHQFRHYNLKALGKKMPARSGTTYVVVVEGYFDTTAIYQLRSILIISFVVGLLLVGVAGWYYAGRALAPVLSIVGEVEQIQPADLSKRVDPGANRDEIARLAETFNRLLDRVEQAFRMQRMFLSNVSHELRNPLTAIRSQLEVALQRERNVESYQKTLKSVLDDVSSLTEVEEELLQLARIYNDPNSIPFTEVRLDELLWQAREQLQKRHVDYTTILEFGEMPANDEVLFVQANEALLLTAIQNLMNNACKYSPDQKVLLRVVFLGNGAHEVSVCDNGPGIPEEEKKLIFEPFFRSPRHLGIKGTGVGLSLVQSILTLHKIQLSVESPAGGGAVFKLEFPSRPYIAS